MPLTFFELLPHLVSFNLNFAIMGRSKLNRLVVTKNFSTFVGLVALSVVAIVRHDRHGIGVLKLKLELTRIPASNQADIGFVLVDLGLQFRLLLATLINNL